MKESEETEEIKTSPLYPYLLQGQQALPNCKPVSVGPSNDARYMTPLPHPITPHYQSDDRGSGKRLAGSALIMVSEKSGYCENIFLFLHEKVRCWYSLVPTTYAEKTEKYWYILVEKWLSGAMYHILWLIKLILRSFETYLYKFCYYN